MSIVKQLENHYGGKWKYCGCHWWECKEKEMHACYTIGGFDINGNAICDFDVLRIYGNGYRGAIFHPNQKRIKNNENQVHMVRV